MVIYLTSSSSINHCFFYYSWLFVTKQGVKNSFFFITLGMDVMMILKFILELNPFMVPFKFTSLFLYNACQQCYL